MEYRQPPRGGGAEAKAAACHVTDDVDKDGLYKAFARLGLL